MNNNLLNSAIGLLGIATDYIKEKSVGVLTTTAVSVALGVVTPSLGPVGIVLAYEPARQVAISLGKDLVFAGKDLITGELTIVDLQNISLRDVLEYTSDKAIEVAVSTALSKFISATFLSKISEKANQQGELLSEVWNDLYNNHGFADVMHTISTNKGFDTIFEGVKVMSQMAIESFYTSKDLFTSLATEVSKTHTVDTVINEVMDNFGGKFADLIDPYL